jgi:PKD repeat protein|tara:strand:+ start:282 stop:1874 length:1593 start_codon:yes stop_codon:yes gene_type:complete
MEGLSKAILIFSLIGGFFVCLNLVFAAANDVIINEIAWMGTEISHNDEWIELHNNTEQNIDLTGWTLKATDGNPEITLNGPIPSQGYFLLERTNDNSVSGITADQIYTGALSNSGENLELRDGTNNLIDSIDALSGWPAGDNSAKQTMEKVNSAWQTSLDAGGTPKAQNSGGAETTPEDDEEQPGEELIEESTSNGITTPASVNQPPLAETSPDITALVNQEIIFDGSLSSDPDNDTLTFFWNFGDGATDTQEKVSHTYLYPGQYLVGLLVSDGEFSDLSMITVNIYNQSIVISEFMPNPEGPDADFEWIEIFNQSNQIANLSNWQLDDQEGGSKPFIFPGHSLIGPEQFLVLTRPVTKLALNNDLDWVRLIYPDGSLANQISYAGEKKQGWAIAFDGQGYFWTKMPTPGSANIISSTGISKKDENISSNNPTPIIQQSQKSPEILAKANLNPSQNFSSLKPTQNSINQTDKPEQSTNPAPQLAASLVQAGQSINRSDQKANLILILSIIISGSLLISWFLILLRNKLEN